MRRHWSGVWLAYVNAPELTQIKRAARFSSLCIQEGYCIAPEYVSSLVYHSRSKFKNVK
jgi:hypothetical protein